MGAKVSIDSTRQEVEQRCITEETLKPIQMLKTVSRRLAVPWDVRLGD